MSTPFPYYIDHALVAAVMMLGVGGVTSRFRAVGPVGWLCGAFAGAFFYLGREFTQWETLSYVDWPGALAPVMSVTLLSAVLLFRRR